MKTINSNVKNHARRWNVASLLTFSLLLLLVISPTKIYADIATIENEQQAKNVKGVIIDALGEPIIGVSIIEKGTTNGMISDIDGKYTLNLQGDNPILVFSYIGFVTQEIPVGSKTEINITMLEDTQVLDEVVVVSYGTQKKRDMTGSIASVKADALADLPVGQIGQKLQGQIAGVQVNQSTGIPGQGMSFRIRGAVSINNSSQPLIVVDGFPLSAGLNNINPDEVESFTVLKDAAATALYGSRAGNGVIMITTKRGKKGKLNTQFQAYAGIQTMGGQQEMDIMNGQEFAQFKKEWYEDAVKYGEIIPTADNPTGVPEYYQNPEIYGKGTDWYKELTQDALIHSYSLSISVYNK